MLKIQITCGFKEGAPGTPPLGSIFFVSMQFLREIDQYNVLAVVDPGFPRGGANPSISGINLLFGKIFAETS